MVQFLEVVRIEGHAYPPEDVALARDMYLLQVKWVNKRPSGCLFKLWEVIAVSVGVSF